MSTKRPKVTVATHATDTELLRPSLDLYTCLVKEIGSFLPPPTYIVCLKVLIDPGLSQKQIAEQLGLSQFAVGRAVKSAMAYKLLKVETVGREHLLHPGVRGLIVKRRCSRVIRNAAKQLRRTVDKRSVQ